MTLSALQRQHRSLSLPLAAVLMLSWCLLLCGMPQAQAQADAGHGHGAPVESMQDSAASASESGHPPCHDETPGDVTADEECPSCEAQPESAGSASASAMILSTLDWMQSLSAPAVSVNLAPIHLPEHPSPPARLHLVKSVFLI